MPGLLQKQDRFGEWNPKTLGMLLVRTSVLCFLVNSQKHVFSFVLKRAIKDKVATVSIIGKVSGAERPVSCVNKNGLSWRNIPKFHLFSWCGNFVETHSFCRV